MLENSETVCQVHLESILHRRHKETSVSNICEAVWISLLSAPNGHNKLPEVCFEFPLILIGKLTMALLTHQS